MRMETALSNQFLLLMALAAAWSLPWKGYALWTAAERREKWWFVALLVINTLAILEIAYLFFVAKKGAELARFFGFKK